MATAATIGIDLAKNVFAVHAVDEHGTPVLVNPRVTRNQLVPLIASMSPCLIGLEACSGAHYWARTFQGFGHTVKLMSPRLVSPYRMSGKTGKNDAADAAAICEAVTRPSMRFVPIKDEHQQTILSLHRIRQGFMEERTAVYNRMRGLLSEFGIVLPNSVWRLRKGIHASLEDVPIWVKRGIEDLLEHVDRIEERLAKYGREIEANMKDDDRGQRLMQLQGVGPMIASALLASIGAGHDFKNGRQVAAWLGLTPAQHSSGGKYRLGKTTKAGDAYVRGLLVSGARAVLTHLGAKQDRFSRWVRTLVERRGYWRAAIAIAAKNARMAWAVLRYGDAFKSLPAAA